MSDAGAGALLLLGLLLFAAAYSWLRSPRDRPDEGWLPREIADGELAFAERRFESKRLGLVARLDRAYRQGGELHLVELKTRGYDNAGLYDPAGVGGTHVMYVLHHADKPNLYHGLPENPEISATVKFWKGIWKPLAAVGFAATFAASIFHYVGVGPNRAEEEEDNLDEEKDEVRK